MKLRYLFDPGSGVCPWAADDEARKAFGYPVQLKQLPLSQEVVALGQQVIARSIRALIGSIRPTPLRGPAPSRSRLDLPASSFTRGLRPSSARASK